MSFAAEVVLTSKSIKSALLEEKKKTHYMEEEESLI